MPIVPNLPPTSPLPVGPAGVGNNAGPVLPQSPPINPSGAGGTFNSGWGAGGGGASAGPGAILTAGNGIYLNTRQAAATLGPGDSALLVNDPDGTRVFLQIRVTVASGDVAAVKFGSVPPVTDPGDEADMELAAGEVAAFDRFVPQNRVYVRNENANGGTIRVVATWADWAAGV